MQLTNSSLTQEITSSSADANYSNQESQAILTLEDLVEILERLDNYLQAA